MGLSSDDMQDILIDTCGWIAVVEANINIDISLNQILGPHQLWLIPQVEEEVNRLSLDKKKDFSRFAFGKNKSICRWKYSIHSY